MQPVSTLEQANEIIWTFSVQCDYRAMSFPNPLTAPLTAAFNGKFRSLINKLGIGNHDSAMSCAS